MSYSLDLLLIMSMIDYSLCCSRLDLEIMFIDISICTDAELFVSLYIYIYIYMLYICMYIYNETQSSALSIYNLIYV